MDEFPHSNPDVVRPLIALTMGDVAGIGPEVLLRALLDPRVSSCCRPIVVGDPDVLKRAAVLIGANISVVQVSADELPAAAHPLTTDVQTVHCWNPSDASVADIPPGQVDARAGRAAHDYLIAAARAALAGSIDAVTTAPLNKAALHRAGLFVPGHTEILAKVCEVDRFAMMLYVPPGRSVTSPAGLGVAHVTLHTSIASVPGLLTLDSISEKIDLVHRFMDGLGCDKPRIGVCALNPHAGEDGAFGDEESRLISPAVAAAVQSGLSVTGPLPADTLFRRAFAGEFDAIVAMYHDQGHIAFKLVAADRAVNVTLGLPIVRTSPSHGTAFDIAWTGRANPEGMIEAILVAARLAEKRDRVKE
ncbi:MAG: 4-hydroxythreonine-4-phosphate dehydrogenase PdxA [Planctomycetes bacterium]|nr:4-hydroxythreonine-4-phosphate dehydrogenase PdxA [Planctomycetota bacterium]